MNDTRKVLIIDDNILDVMAAEKVLARNGYDVVKLASPHGCLAKIDFERPEVLLVDISMPKLNAQELFEAIQQSPEHEDLIIVLFSELDAETLLEICVEHDFHGYFCKSIGIDQVGTFLDQFFEELEE